MRIVHEKITIEELKKRAARTFSDLVKAVVDIEKEIMAVDAELHADEESILLEQGVEGNKSRSVDDPKIQKRIINIVNKLVTK